LLKTGQDYFLPQHFQLVSVIVQQDATIYSLKAKKERIRCRKFEVFIGVVNSIYFGHHYAHHQEYRTKPTNRIRCSALAVL
jgi:hypothetical protein